MDAKGDLEKYLIRIGAKRLPRGTNHYRWGIGSGLLEVPDNITGSRTFRNYKSEAKRKAIAQGLLPPRAKPLPEGLVGAGRRRREKRLKQSKREPSAEEGTAEDVALWQKQRRLEELASRRRFVEEARAGGPMRTSVKFGERVDKMKAAITDAGKPLSHEQICEAVGWLKSYDKETARRALNKAVPEHFRVVPTERKRYPKFDLASNVLQPAGLDRAGTVEAGVGAAGAAEVDAAGASVALKPTSASSAAVSAAGREVVGESVACFWALLEEIGKVVEDARSRDAERAFFTLGKIAGLVEGWQRSANKPAK